MPPERRAARWWPWLRAILTVTALLLLFRRFHASAFAGMWSEVSWKWLAAAFLVYGAEMMVAVAKGAWLLGPRTTTAFQWKVMCAKVFTNQVFPGTLGGDALRAWWNSKHAGSIQRVARLSKNGHLFPIDRLA